MVTNPELGSIAQGTPEDFRIVGSNLREVDISPLRAGNLGVEEGGSEVCATNRLSSSETGSADDKNRP